MSTLRFWKIQNSQSGFDSAAQIGQFGTGAHHQGEPTRERHKHPPGAVGIDIGRNIARLLPVADGRREHGGVLVVDPLNLGCDLRLMWGDLGGDVDDQAAIAKSLVLGMFPN